VEKRRKRETALSAGSRRILVGGAQDLKGRGSELLYLDIERDAVKDPGWKESPRKKEK